MMTRIQVLSSALALLLATSLSSAAHADIYRWQGDDGSTVYSDQKASADAETTAPDSGRVNYYTSPKKPSQPALPKLEAVEDAYFIEPVDRRDQADEPALTEAQCQELYGLNCDRVINWRKYALEACGNDPRCQDPAFLDRKYRPRTKDEMLSVARRAGIRKNNAEDDINEYLRREFTNFCANSAASYCEQKKFGNRVSECKRQMENQCHSPHNIAEMLAQYDHLTEREKKQIIREARQMALASNKDDLNLTQTVMRLIDLALAASALGL